MTQRGIAKPVSFVDVRKLLDDHSIDAISIATPNHWHSLIGIWACQAGKDVYVEKPCSHNLWEGANSFTRPRSTSASCQHGTSDSQVASAATQRRSMDGCHRRHLSGSWTLLQVARYHRPRGGATRPAGVPL